MADCILYGNGGRSTHYTSMPFTAELAGLFEPDSIDITNSLWRNKITGGNDVQLVGGTVDDNALKFTAGQYGHVDAAYPYTYYLVVKKPVLETNKPLCGSYNGSNDKPSIQIWNNGNSQGSFFEVAGICNNMYTYTEDLQDYHIVSGTFVRNAGVYNDFTSESATVCFLVDNKFIGSSGLTQYDVSDLHSYDRFNGSIGLNCVAKGDAGSVTYTYYTTQYDSYIRAFAFGGRQTLEQMQANHKYLYEKYCT